MRQLIRSLEKTLQESKGKVEVATCEIEKSLTLEIESLKVALNDRDHEILSLQMANQGVKDASEKLNKRLTDNKNKYEQEKTHLLKEHRKEVKAWKKDLGEANSKIVKVEKKLKAAETRDLCSCSINGPVLTSIPSTVSKISNTTTSSNVSHPPTPLSMDSRVACSHPLNLVCDKCENFVEDEDSVHHQPSFKQVCVTRQPFPPPFPTITHLVNENSRYHEHMMSKARVPGRYPGHERCMEAYSAKLWL